MAMDTKAQYRRNAIVYEMPPHDWWQGWLAGNGSAGATVWNPEDSLRFQLGHTDLMDRAPDPGLDNLGIPNMRHNLRGRLCIHGAPMFDPFYIQKYHSVTELSSGITRMQGESEFGAFSAEFFYCREPDVFVLRYTEHSKEPLVRSIELEKRGSRFFSRIWTGTEPDTSMGLGDTKIKPEDQLVEITHEKEGFCLADVVWMQTDTPYIDRVNSHSLERSFEAASDFSMELRVCLGMGNTVQECLDTARAAYARCAADTFEQLRDRWESTSEQETPDTGICLPQDPYYENLWYTSRHHMRSCYKGKYPAFFINGPFGGDHDKREWADCWLHWNMHDEIQGVIKNGDWDLFQSFAEYKMRQIPSAREIARREFGCGGMVTQDQQQPDGGNRGVEGDYYKLQIYPCLHTSILFYQYWAFTGDEQFLREKLLPYMSLTLEFWKDYLQEEDGVLHVPRSVPYEFHNGYAFRDCLTELSLLRSCLPLLEKVEQAAGVHTPLQDWTRYAQDHLASFTQLPMTASYVTREENGRRIYDNPFFYGEEYNPEDKVYAIGFSERVQDYVTHTQTHVELMEEGVPGYGAFCSSQSSFVFPSRLVSSDASPEWRERTGQTGESVELWENGRNALRSIRRFPKGTELNYDIKYSDTLSWTGHSLELPAFAKLGLKQPLEKALQFYTQNYQMFPQGMFNYHPRNRWITSCQDYTAPDGRRMRVPFGQLCQHFSFEELGVFTETIDLMLLDSTDGTLRLFPGYDKDAQFRLPAEGGFLVEALQKEGKVLYVKIASRLGGSCRVRVPWQRCWLRGEKGLQELPVAHSAVCFETCQGGTYILTAEEQQDCAQNLTGHEAGPQTNGLVSLGILPCF